MNAVQPGELVAARYRLRSVIGRGGMGVVWLAADELLHRDVAIKEVIWPPQLDEQERDTLRQRVLREARLAARLDHPNIVRIYDVAEHDDRPWIVMQLVPYRSLHDIVRETGPLTPRQTAGIGLRILAAITAAHAAGILHRDVKPGNVLLGPDSHVVLTDFGLAIADGSTRVTTSGLVLGSPAYMSPERAHGQRATLASDLWSLGATLYAAVEGRDAFDRNGALAVLTAIATDEPDRPVHAGPLWPVISALLRKDPAARPSADQVEHDLRAVVSDPENGPSVLPAYLTVPLTPVELAAGAPGADPAADGADDTPRMPRVSIAAAAAQAPPAAPAKPSPPRPVAASPALLPPVPPPSVPAPRPQPSRPVRAPAPHPARPPRRRLPIAAAVIVLLAIAGVSLGLAYSSGNSPAGRPAAGAHSTASRTPPPASPTAGQTSAPSPAPSPTATSSPATHAVSTAGFAAYHDPSGFTIDIPSAWHVSHSGHLVYIQPATGGMFLLIDQTKHPQSNALADWRQQEANRISTYPGYRRIRLAAVPYAPAEQAADWEFTYYDNGTLTHVLNRNVLVNKHLAYALYWSVPQAQWPADYHYFRTFAATFQPASPKQGSGTPEPGS
jgi:serine/threonine protein kinase